jgi:ATP-dependent RNA helicase RhlE
LNDNKQTFDELGLSDDLVQATKQAGYTHPSPIQAQSIPIVLQGHDLLAAAQTGTGKTAGFTLPMLQILSKGKRASHNQARALVLTPTRELAAQVDDSVRKYGKHLPLTSTVVFGGVKINPQMMRLRSGTDILVATPGRLLDLYNQNAVKFDQLEMLVLDEADRMLDMGFIHDIKKILALLPKKRQNLLFSATFSDEIRQLAKSIVHQPKEISVTPRNAAAVSVTQWLVPVDKKQKSALLIHLIKENNWHQALVFTRTKHGANKLTKQLDKAGISAAAIHGNKSQGARTKALSDFKNLKTQILVATDIAARGLDINQMPQVVNFDLPNVAEDYVHRIGRTGRAGATGTAVSLVSADEIDQLRSIERLIKKTIDREYIPGFEPDHEVPESRLDTRPQKPGQPKKPKKPGNPNHPGKPASDRKGRSHGEHRGNQKPGAPQNRRPSLRRRRRKPKAPANNQ